LNRIFCIVGKSGSGKDTIYNKIINQYKTKLIPVIPFTTRPKRADEKNGVNYFFVSKAQMNDYAKNNKIIEKRQYNTIQGVWDYFTLKFDITDNNDYILITTLEGAHGIIKEYGSETVHIIYLYLDDKERLIRCINREAVQENPDYTEICRRFIADQHDFSDENLRRFKNIHYINTYNKLNDCLYQWNKIYNK
jgi:guanylate kinase